MRRVQIDNERVTAVEAVRARADRAAPNGSAFASCTDPAKNNEVLVVSKELIKTIV